MGVSSDGTSIESALEVKPTAPSGGDEGASPSPSGAEDQDDRKALNRAKEALKKVGKLEEAVAEANRLNQQLVERLLQSPGQEQAAPAAEATPPHSQVELQAAIDSGDNAGWSQMFSKNAEWSQRRMEQSIRDGVSNDLATTREQDRLNAHLMKSLGLANSDAEYARAIDQEAARVQREFPAMDKQSARVVAAGTVYRQAAIGELEFEDLRQESIEKRQETTVDKPRGSVPEPTYDMDAPNRGLSKEMVDKIKANKLGHVLTKSDNPEREEHYRFVIDDILGHEAKIAKRRAAMG